MDKTQRTSLIALAVATLGIVYGDIGTSPLYALKECFHGLHGIAPARENIMGVLSLVFWSLTMVISVKYLVFIMRADNRGEGGIFALLALVPGDPRKVGGRARWIILIAALFGAALLYSDGMITPAISVLSAVEGLVVGSEGARPFVVPITCLIILALFLVQRFGTHRLGNVFGIIMVVWFASLMALGVRSIVTNPEILHAINPLYAVAFFKVNQFAGFIVLGAVVLVITGGEAIYADMGHFGKSPIRISWFSLTYPALLCNYFGQGALLLSQPDAANPFYALVPRQLLYPMIILATMATVIASQAMISGAFSLTRQAIQLGFCPRMRMIHTSGEKQGQIYIPTVNTALMVSCIGLVLLFQESSKLAAAYGVAVTADMTITSVIFSFVLVMNWKWPLWKALPLVAIFLFFDLAYFTANLLKFVDGGWFPLAIALFIAVCLTTWKRGRMELSQRIASTVLPLDLFLKDITDRKPHRVEGTAVFMSSIAEGSPPVLLHHFKHNQVLHKQVVLLSIQVTDSPYVRKIERLELQDLGEGFFRLIARYGFMESPDVPEIMRQSADLGLKTDPAMTSFYLGRETLLTNGPARMARWRKKLFGLIAKNAQSPTAYFGIPPGRVVELGVQINL
jgi:KUP system potassium uptake protein